MHATDPITFQIGLAVVGHKAPVYVIAEIGVNHDGELHRAREMIHAAADAEADAVKFQVFSADRLVIRTAPAAAYQRETAGSATQYEMLSRLELDAASFAELADYAGRCGVEFLATPFSLEDLDLLVSLGIRAIKLASPDIVNVPLLDAAAETGLPVIASTGAATLEEVRAAVARFKYSGAGPLALLHCVSSYPTPDDQASLGAIGTLARTFNCPAGFSDHTESIAMGGYAVAAGACIIEKHFTLDRTAAGPDHAFSLEPDALAEYIRHIRYVERLVGDGSVEPRPCEQEIRALARSSIVAARDIRAGEMLTRSLLAVKRPGNGIGPSDLASLVGREVKTEIPADTPISWDVVR